MLLEKRLDSDSAYDNKYIRTKTKSYDGKINTNFQSNGYHKKVCAVLIFL